MAAGASFSGRNRLDRLRSQFMGPVAMITWIVSFVVVTVTVTGLSRKAGWSAPVTLVVVGAAASFLPGMPAVEVEPELVLYGILPPLLFAAALRTPVADVRARGDSILLLSVGMVVVTVLVVGFTVSWLLPTVGLAAAFALGAVVGPTDAVAVTAIAGRLRMPRRVVTVLETESLLNDAAALVALNAAIVAIAGVVHPVDVAFDFVVAVVGGVGFGLAAGFVIAAIRKQLHSPVLDTALSLVTPYVAFLSADLVGGSGVIAVVVAGLFLGYTAPLVQSAEARIAESIIWRTIRFLLENAVFLFIGLSLAGVASGLQDSSLGPWQIAGLSVAVLLVITVARFALVMAATAAYKWGAPVVRRRFWGWSTGIAISAAGIRGVVTLAAVFLLPEETPERELLQFLAFVVVAGTLAGGLGLPALIRRLKLPPPNDDQDRVERENLASEARAAGLQRLDADASARDEEAVISQLRSISTFFAEAPIVEDPDETESLPTAYGRLRRGMIAAEREAVLAARAEGRYQEPAVRAVLAAIDAEEAALSARAPRRPENRTRSRQPPTA